MNVLIVEDDGRARHVMQRLILARGHEVTACQSAEEAEKTLATQVFQMAILDWMLPGKTGLEFCRWLREQENGEDIYVLLITARGTSADLDEALDARANDYLVKPWEGESFRARIRIAERQVMDISERIRSRAALRESARQTERLALVAQQTQSGVVILGPQGNIEWTNSASRRMLRIPEDGLQGKDFAYLLHAEADSILLHEIKDAIASNRSSEGEVAMLNADAVKHWLHYSLTPLEADQGKPRGLVCVFSDITAVKKADEERFKNSKIESLGVLAGGIAHDLNNILTVISGNISLASLSLERDLAASAAHLGKANSATLRAADLSKQLLTFAKGGDPLKQAIDTREMVEKATRFALYGSNLTSSFALSKTLEKVEADPFQLEQVINNIIINAREAMPSGGRIQVTGENVEITESNPYDLLPGEYVHLSFTDNGPGISPEVLPQIFDPYFTTKPTGSGLGLSISFSVISKHGGRIFAVSEGEGATFGILLPVASSANVAGEAEISPEDRPRAILCMDDEPSIRELLTAILSMSGYAVTTACDGEEAVALYQSRLARGEAFDVVVLDATIPGGMGGVDTIKALLQIDPEVRAIICSGYSDESALTAMESFGFRASLPKPFTTNQLCDLIEKVIRSTPTPVGAHLRSLATI